MAISVSGSSGSALPDLFPSSLGYELEIATSFNLVSRRRSLGISDDRKLSVCVWECVCVCVWVGRTPLSVHLAPSCKQNDCKNFYLMRKRAMRAGVLLLSHWKSRYVVEWTGLEPVKASRWLKEWLRIRAGTCHLIKRIRHVNYCERASEKQNNNINLYFFPFFHFYLHVWVTFDEERLMELKEYFKCVKRFSSFLYPRVFEDQRWNAKMQSIRLPAMIIAW